MKPYGREKNIKGSGIWKKDYHIRPKKHWQNWWEVEFDNFISRGRMKQILRKDINDEINNQ